VAVTDDLIFATDTLGTLNCLDKATGLTIWEHKVGPVWFASPLVADGKVYVANNIGRMTVLAASREKKVLGSVKTGLSAITPAVANGVVIVSSCGSLVCYSSQPTLPADAAKAQLPSTPATQVRQVAPKTGEGVQ
jgi:outer membrane protein assembly factor BamB